MAFEVALPICLRLNSITMAYKARYFLSITMAIDFSITTLLDLHRRYRHSNRSLFWGTIYLSHIHKFSDDARLNGSILSIDLFISYKFHRHCLFSALFSMLKILRFEVCVAWDDLNLDLSLGSRQNVWICPVFVKIRFQIQRIDTNSLILLQETRQVP